MKYPVGKQTVKAVYDNEGTRNPLIEALPGDMDVGSFYRQIRCCPPPPLAGQHMTLGERKQGLMSAILRMPLGKAWLFERGAAPQEVRKYDLKQHPLYNQLPEYPTGTKQAMPYGLPAYQQEPLPPAVGL